MFAKVVKFLEEKNTRLRHLTGFIVVMVWVVVTLAFLIGFLAGLAVAKIAFVFYTVTSLVGGILGIHMMTKPGEIKVGPDANN